MMITQTSGIHAMERQSRAYRQESSGGWHTDRTHCVACVLTHYQLWAHIGPQTYIENYASVLQSNEVPHVGTVV